MAWVRIRCCSGQFARNTFKHVPVVDPIITLVATYSVACLFLFACYGKLTAFAVFRATFAEYELVPERLTGLIAALVVAIELAIVMGALYVPSAAIAMMAAATLLLVYAAAIEINLLRGRRDIDCGCTGPARRQLISGWLVLRNCVLAAVALLGSAAPSARAMQAADFVLVGLALLGAISLYAAVNQLMANAPRLDALDSIMDSA